MSQEIFKGRVVEEGYDELGRMIDPNNGRPYVLGRPFHGFPTYIYTDTWKYKARQVLKWLSPAILAGGLALIGHLVHWF